MYVLADLRDGSFDLIEPGDCTRFHVQVVGARNERALAEILAECGRLDSDDHAWISIEAVRRMAQGCTSIEWDADYDAMISFASGKGWLDDRGEHIRVHVEWPEPADLG